MSAVSRHTRRAARGFTLVEVMITLVILAFGLLALGAMQLVALKQGSAGRHTGDGASIARSHLEQAVRLPWATLTAAAGGGWIAPGWAGAPSANVNVNLPSGGASTEHAYTVLWRVTNIGVAPICLRDIEVRVTWQEEGFPAPKAHEVGTRRYNQGDASC
jgi:prepilin-type N-terminal cleavage/methylation domain-containing protein